MNDLDRIKQIAFELGRECKEGSSPESAKIVYQLTDDGFAKELYFQTCNLLNETIPNLLWDFKKIEKLSLKDNQLLNFPIGLEKLKTLKELDMNNNQFRTLSGNIGKLINIERLDLSDNKLMSLPDEIKKLTALKHLRLNDNLISILPDFEEESIWSQLETLDLDYAQLSVIPKWVYRLTNLKALSLTGMQLDRFPEGIKDLDNLEMLFLDSTNIRHWPNKIELPSRFNRMILDGAILENIPCAIIELKPQYVENQRAWRKLEESCVQVSLGNLFENLDRKLLYSADREVVYQYLSRLFDSETGNLNSQRIQDIKIVLLGTGSWIYQAGC